MGALSRQGRRRKPTEEQRSPGEGVELLKAGHPSLALESDRFVGPAGILAELYYMLVILPTRKQRLREVGRLARGYTAGTVRALTGTQGSWLSDPSAFPCSEGSPEKFSP